MFPPHPSLRLQPDLIPVMFNRHAEFLAQFAHGPAQQAVHFAARLFRVALADGGIDREVIGQGFDVRLGPARRQAEGADQGGFNQHAKRFHEIVARRIQNPLMEHKVGNIDRLGAGFGLFHLEIGGFQMLDLFRGGADGSHRGGMGFVMGTFFGGIIMGVIQTLIAFDGSLNSWWTKIMIGALLFGFIVLQRLITRSFSGMRAGAN